MKYIYFVALHLQNNCAKFQRILPRNMDKFDFFPFSSTQNRGRSCFHGNRLLSKFIGNTIFARPQCNRHRTLLIKQMRIKLNCRCFSARDLQALRVFSNIPSGLLRRKPIENAVYCFYEITMKIKGFVGERRDFIS